MLNRQVLQHTQPDQWDAGAVLTEGAVFLLRIMVRCGWWMHRAATPFSRCNIQLDGMLFVWQALDPGLLAPIIFPGSGGVVCIGDFARDAASRLVVGDAESADGVWDYVAGSGPLAQC